MKFTKIEIIQRVNFDKYFRRKLMKKFLWLVVALAAMVLVGCKEEVQKPGKESVIGTWP